MADTNPNGANQYKLDPRQRLFKEFYTNPDSETFSNAYRSALKAGYSDEYAKGITSERQNEWFSEIMGDLEMIQIAEKNLKEFMTMDTYNTGMNKQGETFEFDDAGLKRIKADITKFVSERLNKRKYAQKSEIDAKVTGDLNINIVTYDPKLDDST